MSQLTVTNVGKSYRQYASEWQRVGSWFGLRNTAKQENWVLRNVDFSVQPGEAIGIIGQNGAGKSTLLKLITGTLQPTEGSVHINGKVAAILELGMGFNPEFTARQNAYQAAGLMGYSLEEISITMPVIEDFAEIGDYFDKPMRTFSSGMIMRVAFSVVTAFRPEVLIVDEALSVGDSYFQHKSFNRIREFREEGSTILFVSHSMADVKTLCDRVILLDKGKAIKEGSPDEVVDFYNALIAARENSKLTISQRRNKEGWLETRSGTGEATVIQLTLTDSSSGHDITLATVGQVLRLSAEIEVREDVSQLVLGFMIRDKLGHVVWGSNTWHQGHILKQIKAGEKVKQSCEFACSIGSGSYSVTSALTLDDTHLTRNFEWVDNNLVFDVINVDKPVFIGSNYLETKWYDQILISNTKTTL